MSNDTRVHDDFVQSNERDENALREELSVFGLSDTEIDAYLTLLAQGEASTSDVAEGAGVTQRAVYDIAGRLEDRGLVRVKDHASPTAIQALPPQEAIENLSSRLDSITPTLEERYNDTTEQAPEIQIVKSRETALKRLRNSIAQAEREALVAIPEQVYPALEPELRDAVARGVFVFLLIGELDERDADEQQFVGAANVVRYWNANLPFLSAVDDEFAIIGDTEVLGSPHADSDAVTVSQRHLSRSVVGMYLSAYWPVSTELHVADPAPLPQSFEVFRKAAFHAFLHHQEGTDLRADVRTRSGERIEGTVTQVRQAFVEPTTNEYTLETSLSLDAGDEEVSFGGPGAFIEAYEVDSLILEIER